MSGQAEPKTARKGAIGLHPLVVGALRRHRSEMIALGLYDPEGFVFCTRNGTPMSVSNLRRAFKQLCKKAAHGHLLGRLAHAGVLGPQPLQIVVAPAGRLART